MIKHIINIIKSWFTSKSKEVKILIKEVKKEHCDGNLGFKKSCPVCQEIIK